MKFFKQVDQLLAKVFIVCIRVYQKTLSFDHSWYAKYFPHRGCRFYPSCSEYGAQVLQKKGFVKGAGQTVCRCLRCNPWSKGGVDKP